MVTWDSPVHRRTPSGQQDLLCTVGSMPMRQFVGFFGDAVPQSALDQLVALAGEARPA